MLNKHDIKQRVLYYAQSLNSRRHGRNALDEEVEALIEILCTEVDQAFSRLESFYDNKLVEINKRIELPLFKLE